MPDPTPTPDPTAVDTTIPNDVALAQAGAVASAGTTPLAPADSVLEPDPVAVDQENRPAITKAQIVAGIPILAEFGHAFGIFTLSQPQQDSLNHTVTWAFVLIGGDAVIRFGRNLYLGLKARA